MRAVYLYREPWNVPARYTSDILDHNLKVGKLDHGDCVESYVEQYEGPFKEGVNGISCVGLATFFTIQNANLPPGIRCTLCLMKK